MFFRICECTIHWISAKSLNLEWIWPIVTRNLLGCWIICGFWDWFLYLSPFQQKLMKFKVCNNPVIKLDFTLDNTNIPRPTKTINMFVFYVFCFILQMNPKYPSFKQLSHDAFHSTIATFCASTIEIVLCYGWANRYIHIRHHQLSDNILLYALMAIGISHMRKPHFYITHRIMHPWRVS